MKITLVLFTVVLFTDAAMFNDNDIDPSLVSYLLAKVQQLESKVMARPNIWDATNNMSPWPNTWDGKPSNIRSSRSTRQAVAKSVKTRSTPVQCNCSLSVATYIRWGNSTCPYGADTIYSGFGAGSFYTHSGAAVNQLCLPPDPKYLKYKPDYQGWAELHGVEYETYAGHSHDYDMACALCQVHGRTSTIMIPSHYECPFGWRREYYGYLMAGYHGHKASTQYTCIDESFEHIPGSKANYNGRLLYTVEAYCGNYFPCSDKELTCAVCTK